MEIRASSAWPRDGIQSFLERQRIPLRLACLDRRDEPLVCSLWYLFEEGSLWCATQKSARVVDYLTRNPACGFEVAPESPPYMGVRGQAAASLSAERGPEVLLRLIDRYLGDRETSLARWLIARSSDEVAIRLSPRWLTSWDYSGRMGG